VQNQIFRIFISIITILVSGCGVNTTSHPYDINESVEISNPLSYQPLENPVASKLTSFAQDLKIYDIPSLDEKTEASIKKASTISNDNNLTDNNSSDNNISIDNTDTNSTNIDINQTDTNSTNPYSNFSSYDTFTGAEEVDYIALGDTDVTLNNKYYHFKIAKDNLKERIKSPSFTSSEDNSSYTISITSYIITDEDVVKKEDGIFTFIITVPSLNTSGSYKVESNVLTNSAQEDIFAEVVLSENENGLILNVSVAKFQVFNRDKTRSYPATFSIQYHSQ